ncbi:MDR family MFS transporter [Halobacillus aidingensis]|uniref:MFS transporter, DHA1 family, multidrug resistance protein B n=1 Tax=Halobacillus aidingensis TaxID=240303 RepID=A0A1H0LSX2_HALAD|nr:MFS transporter [Halobacillus aidingensis]SDO71288.1 MFS transporter, DHA1 family, multidrug resistance protein B [Halobacillus aidingensis]
MFKELHPNIRIRIYTSFLSRVVGAAVFPFMAIYFTKEINATVAGVLLLIQVEAQFLTGLYGGYLADIIGRKRLMVTGEILKLTAFIGMFIANSPWLQSAWMTFFMLLLIGIAGGLVNPAAEAMLIDVSTKDSRAFMYAINYWAINMSMMIGLMIGGWFFERNLFELIAVLLGISLLTLWMTSTKITDTYVVSEEKVREGYGLKPVLKNYSLVMKDVPFLAFTIGGIAILGIEFQRNNFISVRLEQDITSNMMDFFGLFSFELDGIRLLSLLTVANTLFIVLFTSLFSKWIKGKKEEPIMYAGFALFGLGYAFLAFSNHIPGLFIAVIVLSVGELLYVPTRQSILADIVDDTRRGAYMAFNGLVFQFGKILGALGIIIGNVIGGYGMAVLYVGLVFAGIHFSRMAILRRKSPEEIVLEASGS